jgi:two-component system, cell cycle sensor histidine kinase and response regulator CckA
MPPAPRVVLIADDNRDIGVLLTRIMRPLGLAPIVVTTGADAIAAARHHALELAAAFLDIQMPDMSGVDAAIVLQQLVPQLPIVLMSGGIPAHLASNIGQLSLAGFLQKPFRIDEVRTLLTQLGLTGTIP